MAGHSTQSRMAIEVGKSVLDSRSYSFSHALIWEDRPGSGSGLGNNERLNR